MSKEEAKPIQFKGLVRWASVPPNPARMPPKDYINPLAPKNSSYSIEVECSKVMFDKLIKAGIPKLTQLKEDEATKKTYIKISAAKVRRIDGEDITFGDPFVVDAGRRHFPEAIGNGSEAIVIAELAQAKKGKVLRLKGVQVLKHVPYVPIASTDKYADMLELDETLAAATDNSVPFEGGEDINDFL